MKLDTVCSKKDYVLFLARADVRDPIFDVLIFLVTSWTASNGLTPYSRLKSEKNAQFKEATLFASNQVGLLGTLKLATLNLVLQFLLKQLLL